MQTRSSDWNSVCPSVRPSVRLSVCLSNSRIVTKWKNNLSRFLNHTKDDLPSFPRKRTVGGGAPLLPEIADFEHIIACSASAVITSEKSSISTYRKSTTRFPMSLYKMITVYVTAVFPLKCTSLEESLLQSFFV